MIRLALASFVLLSATASAADRTVGVASFARVRVTGPFEVTHRIGPPGARVSGDPRVIERVELRVDGSTLTVRMTGLDWGEQRVAAPTAPIKVALSSPGLTAVSVFAGGRVTAERVKASRVDLSVSGAGEIGIADAAADQLVATVVGAGGVKLAGRAGRVRLITNGAGAIDAEGLRADELVVLLDGPGETKAAARYKAQVTNTGLGSVTVAGTPTCTVSARGGGAVRCGR